MMGIAIPRAKAAAILCFPLCSPAGMVNDQEAGIGDDDRQEDRQHPQIPIIGMHRTEPHGCHPGVVHGCDARPHEYASRHQVGGGHAGTAHHEQCDAGGNDGGEQ
jgi:hypothetical protein